jgi:YHS domain-containing protein
MKKLILSLLTLASVATMSGAVDAAKPYPLKTCVVSGEELGTMGKPYVLNHEGREVQFCCKSCLPKFQKDPAKYLKKLDEAAKK